MKSTIGFCTAVRPRGFGLIEVLVSLVVISIGLLGIAKIQALAYSRTASANWRSLAAVQASSLASAMRANRLYWSTVGTGLLPGKIDITTTNSTSSITASDTTLTQTQACVNAASACTSAQIAGFDLQAWATSLQNSLPGTAATISCPTNSSPVNCNITISWSEQTVGINQQSSAQATAVKQISYQEFVEP
jgi:type IV pilus assembly protein PilV